MVVCTNEGNADMGTAATDFHIAAFGLDKIVPDRESLGVFTRLLARSATGQPITSYTAHYSKPKKWEFHIIIVDNGRSEILGNEEHRKVLNCIRCGACMNTCPVYRRSGGIRILILFRSYWYQFRYGTCSNKHAGNLSACSLCLSCSMVCPAKVDLGEQIYKWRQKLDELGESNTTKKILSKGMKLVMDNPALFNAALWAAPMVNKCLVLWYIIN